MCEKAIPFNPTMEHANNIMMNTGRRDKRPSCDGDYIYFSGGNCDDMQLVEYRKKGL